MRPWIPVVLKVDVLPQVTIKDDQIRIARKSATPRVAIYHFSCLALIELDIPA